MSESSSSSDSSGSSSNGSGSGGSGGQYQLVPSFSSSTAALTAVAQVGAGGAASESTPEYFLSGAAGESDGQLAWQENEQGELDSEVSVQLVADLAGPDDSTWAVGTGSAVALSAGGSGYVTKVQIGVIVDGTNLKAYWDALQLTFRYDGGSEVVTLPSTVTPSIDTLATGSGGTQVVEIVPLNGNCTDVDVIGYIGFQSNVTGMPGSQAMIGKILVFGGGT